MVERPTRRANRIYWFVKIKGVAPRVRLRQTASQQTADDEPPTTKSHGTILIRKRAQKV